MIITSHHPVHGSSLHLPPLYSRLNAGLLFSVPGCVSGREQCRRRNHVAENAELRTNCAELFDKMMLLLFISHSFELYDWCLFHSDWVLYNTETERCSNDPNYTHKDSTTVNKSTCRDPRIKEQSSIFLSIPSSKWNSKSRSPGVCLLWYTAMFWTRSRSLFWYCSLTHVCCVLSSMQTCWLAKSYLHKGNINEWKIG